MQENQNLISARFINSDIQIFENISQIIEVSREPVHAVNHYHLAGSHKNQQCIELWPVLVFARYLVAKDAIQLDTVE